MMSSSSLVRCSSRATPGNGVIVNLITASVEHLRRQEEEEKEERRCERNFSERRKLEIKSQTDFFSFIVCGNYELICANWEHTSPAASQTWTCTHLECGKSRSNGGRNKVRDCRKEKGKIVGPDISRQVRAQKSSKLYGQTHFPAQLPTFQPKFRCYADCRESNVHLMLDD